MENFHKTNKKVYKYPIKSIYCDALWIKQKIMKFKI